MSDVSHVNRAFQRSFLTITRPFYGANPLVNTRSFEWTDFRFGSEDPSWKDKVRLGQDATGPLEAERQVLAWRPSDRKLVTTNDSGWIETFNLRGAIADCSTYSFSVNDFLSHLGQADNLALIRLHNDIQGKINQVSGGTFTGELRETIKMLRRPGAGIRKAVETYLDDVSKLPKKLGKWKRRGRMAREYANALSSAFLEFTFGIKPFVNDIREISSIFGQNDDIRRSSARGHANLEWEITTVDNSAQAFHSTTYFPMRNVTRLTRGVRVIYRCGINHALSAPFGSFERLKEMSGFTWNQFVPTVYNLLPYSWLVDYFTTLGDCISCLATDRSVVSWVNRTVIYTRNVYNTCTWDKAQARLNWPYPDTPTTFMILEGSPDLGYAMSHFQRVQRGGSTFRYPTVEFRMPPADSAKWLNVMALVLQGATVSKSIVSGLR